MLETVVGSILGLLLVWFGVYWVLWSSLVLTLLVHLRSEKSINDGVAILDRSWDRIVNTNASRRLAFSSVGAAAAFAVTWIFLVGPVILDRFGWVGNYQRYVLLGFVALNIVIASVVFVVSLTLVLLTELRPVEPKNKQPPNPSRTSVEVGLMVVVTILLPGVIVGATGCFVVIRAVATLMNVRDGIGCFLKNWSTLMLKTDLASEPELLPGLPEDHTFSFSTLLSEYRRPNQRFSDKYGNLLVLAIFVPSLIYRLILKSSFWFYAPLLWAATPPQGLGRDDKGRLRWDPTLARTPIDIVAATVALVGTFFLFFRVWDYESYESAATWAQNNNFPAYWPLLAAGLNPVRLDIWYLLPGAASLLSLVVFVWAMQISSHARLAQRFPSQGTLWCLYKLNSAKNALSLSTVVVGFCFLLIYFGTICLLPSVIQSVVAILVQTECKPI